MKRKLMPLLVGAIALTFAATPLVLHAQSDRPIQDLPQFAGVELTQDQQDELAQIREETRAQIEAILTPEQLELFRAAKESGQVRREAFAQMNLSDEQRAQIREIREAAKSESQAILTPEQQEQIRENMRSLRQQRRQQPQ